jgi:hypothetical protein
MQSPQPITTEARPPGARVTGTAADGPPGEAPAVATTEPLAFFSESVGCPWIEHVELEMFLKKTNPQADPAPSAAIDDVIDRAEGLHAGAAATAVGWGEVELVTVAAEAPDPAAAGP